MDKTKAVEEIMDNEKQNLNDEEMLAISVGKYYLKIKFL